MSELIFTTGQCFQTIIEHAKEELLHAKEFVLELAKEKLEQAQELEHAK